MTMLQPKIITTLKQYNLRQFYADLIAGIIVGIVALPLAIAFGIASGVAPQNGLITAIIAGFLISLLGGSRVQIGGPTGAFIVVIYGIVEQYGVNGLTIATIMAGIMLVLMGLFRLGSVIKFIPYPVIVGFTSGIAMVIFSSQVKDFLGLDIDKVPAGFIEKWLLYAGHLHSANWYAVALSVFTVVTVVWFPRITTLVPGSLAAIVVATLAVQFLNLPVATIGSRFGQIAIEFPAPHLPAIENIHTLKMLIQPAFTIAMLGAIESLLSAMVADGIIGSNHRSNMELVAQGTANIVVPLFGGIPATGAIARTITNIKNGGRTPVAGIIHAITLLLILLFLGKWARLIPMPCLAGILVVVAYNMSEWRSFKDMFNHPKSDISVMVATFLLTVLIDLTVAIQVGLLLAMVLFVRRTAETSEVQVIKSQFDTDDELPNTGTDAVQNLSLQLPPQTQVYEINGPFFFGAANKFDEALRRVSALPKVRIIRMQKVPFIDATGINNLKSLCQKSKNEGIHIILSEVNEQPMEVMDKSGLLKMLGPGNVFPDISGALQLAAKLVKTPQQPA
ncbi:STAS domain-containing protein [Sphingobacteriales bacterium UPWRP_1]|nr:sodium-independent anion transporter [Sphingobacteriales bacterium TSM_CSM]PSJ77074.1 STAS domain-containing protein [Sphingobacteriales bacterium UPWRP_1]